MTLNHVASSPEHGREQDKVQKETESAPAQLSMDRRVAFETWHQICSHLYPSQLSRMSMVSTTLQDVVDSLPYWSLLFRRVFGPKKTLYLLPHVPESKSYSLYMCASSSLMCEQCYKYFDHYPAVSNAADLPWPVLLRPYRQKQGDTEVLGCPADPDWTIQMCLFCRINHYALAEEHIPYAAYKKVIDWEFAQGFFLEIEDCYHLAQGYERFLESDLLKLARSKFGGDVGIRAMATGSVDERFENTDRRIREYSHRHLLKYK